MPNSRLPQSAQTDDHRPDRLEAYLDGLLTGDDLREFEAELTDNEQLRNECELQSTIDASLCRTFVAPAPIDILALAAREKSDSEPSDSELSELPPQTQPDTKKRRRVLMIVLAASMAWLVVGLRIYRQSTDDGYRELAMVDVYERCVDRGFQPKWVCEDDRQFAETFQNRQGLPLLLKEDAKNVMVGLSYLKGIGPQTTTMLARVDDEPILIFVDSLESDTRPEKPSWWSGLKLFRQELDGLVLYEITPLSEPRVLSSFYIPDMSDLPVRNMPKKWGTEEKSGNSP